MPGVVYPVRYVVVYSYLVRSTAACSGKYIRGFYSLVPSKAASRCSKQPVFARTLRTYEIPGTWYQAASKKRLSAEHWLCVRTRTLLQIEQDMICLLLLFVCCAYKYAAHTTAECFHLLYYNNNSRQRTYTTSTPTHDFIYHNMHCICSFSHIIYQVHQPNRVSTSTKWYKKRYGKRCCRQHRHTAKNQQYSSPDESWRPRQSSTDKGTTTGRKFKTVNSCCMEESNVG